jgi:hypothetical protein
VVNFKYSNKFGLNTANEYQRFFSSVGSGSVRILIIFPDTDLLGSVSFSLIRIRFPNVLGSGSVTYANEHNSVNRMTTYACWLGPSGPTDKENQVKMNKKYRFRYICQSADPDSLSNSWIWIHIRLKSRTRIRIKLKSMIRIHVKMTWIRNT